MSEQPVQTWDGAAAREYAKGKLSELLGEIVWRTPGANDLERRKALEMSADQFLRQTKAWRERVALPPPEPAWGPHPCFFFGPHPGFLPSGVLACSAQTGSGVPVGVVSPGAGLFFRAWPRWHGPFWTFHPGPARIMWDAPFAPWALPWGGPAPEPEIYLSIAPGGDELPEEVLRRWGAAIADGAYNILAMQPNKPWSDPHGAQLAANRFNAAAVTARAEAEPKDLQGQPTARNPIPFC